MKLENLVEILKVWNIASGNTNMIAMLEGEKSPDEYVAGVFVNSDNHLKELKEKLEKEKNEEHPSENLIELYNSWIKNMEVMRKRLSLYRDKQEAS